MKVILVFKKGPRGVPVIYATGKLVEMTTRKEQLKNIAE